MIYKIANRISNLIWQKALFGRPKSLRILTYHGLVENYQDRFLERNFITYKEFEAELDFLTKKFAFISIPEILERKGNFSNEIAITFDDGYANNLIASEILLRRKIPFTIFLTTSSLGVKGRSIWPVDLSLLLLKGDLEKIYLFDKVWYLNGDEKRKFVYKEIREILKNMKSQEKNKFFHELLLQYPENELELLHTKFPNFKMLSVDQAKQLSLLHLCNLGSHGYQHEILHRSQDKVIIESEIKKSVEQFTNYFGHHPDYYAYPNGDSSDVAEKTIKELGFKAAFLNKPLLQTSITDHYQIPRLNIPNNLRACKQFVNRY